MPDAISGKPWGFIGGGAAAPYVPSGVTLHPETMLGVLPPASVDINGGVNTSHVVISFWMRGYMGRDGTDRASVWSFWSNWLLDLFTGISTTTTSESTPGFTFVHDNAGATYASGRFNFNDATGGNNHSFQAFKANYYTPLNAVWHHFLIVADMGFPLGSKRFGFCIDGVQQVMTSANEIGVINAFDIALNSAFGWALNGHTTTGVRQGHMDLADYFLDSHTAVSGFIDAANVIDPAVIAKFYNAGPVYLGADGSLPFGTPADIFLTGDKTTFTTNAGSGAAPFALSNPITGGTAPPVIFNAPSNPGSPPTTRPYLSWVQFFKEPVLGVGTAAFTSITNAGNPIALGDLLVFHAILAETAVSVNRAITTASPGWAPVPAGGLGNPLFTAGPQPLNAALFYKFADAGDVTAAGALWAAPPAITWTPSANACRNASWAISCYKNASAIDIAGSAVQNSVSVAPAAPSVTVTAQPALLVSSYGIWTSVPAFQPPASQELRHKNYATAANGASNIAIADDVVTATGATGVRTASLFSASASICFNMAIR